jgi:hypothetical protein
MNLAQSILQSFQLKKTLNPDIWTLDKDDQYVLRTEIRDKLLLISNDFLEFVDIGPLDCDVVSKECTIEDVTITGSICNFNWSKFSDIDLHLVVDYDEVDENEELVNNILMTKKNLWNASHNVSIKNYEVEVYVQNSEELHFSSGVYSVLFNKWLIAPKKVNVKLDINKVLKKATGWMELIDSLQSRAYGMSPEEIIEVINRIKEKLKRFRMCGLEKGGEFSYENLAFKFLRRSGYIKKLFDLKNKVVDLSLSLD